MWTVRTLKEAVVGFGPDVTMLGGEDPNRVDVGLCREATNSVQLHTELFSCQQEPIAVVDGQLVELDHTHTETVLRCCQGPVSHH